MKRKSGFQKGHKVIRTKDSYKKGGIKIKETRIKNNSYIQSDNTKKKISDTLKYKYKNKIINKPKTTWIKGNKINLGRKHSNETKRKIRISKQEYFKKLGPREGKNEKRILDYLEKLLDKKIIRQYSIIGYFIDGYISELNLAIEIDENWHYDENNNLNSNDLIRQKEIEEKLKCKFVRIKDGLKKIN